MPCHLSRTLKSHLLAVSPISERVTFSELPSYHKHWLFQPFQAGMDGEAIFSRGGAGRLSLLSSIYPLSIYQHKEAPSYKVWTGKGGFPWHTWLCFADFPIFSAEWQVVAITSEGVTSFPFFQSSNHVEQKMKEKCCAMLSKWLHLRGTQGQMEASQFEKKFDNNGGRKKSIIKQDNKRPLQWKHHNQSLSRGKITQRTWEHIWKPLLHFW